MVLVMSNLTAEDILRSEVHAVWDSWPVPPPDDLQIVADKWGEQVWAAFAAVPPMAVDIDSAEFLQCTPLLDLPPRAATAYLGTYLRSFLDGAVLQRDVGLFHDILTRPHLFDCLESEEFWRTCLVPCMSPPGRAVVLHFVNYLIEHQADFAIPPEDAAEMRRLAEMSGFGIDG